MMQVPVLSPLMSFDEACGYVLDYLKTAVPLGWWSVTHYDGDRQVYLHVRDDAYGTAAGGSHLWSDSFCQHMVTGAAPQIAPDAMAVAHYRGAGVASALPIGAYVGIPIQSGDGEMFGTLCGLDPVVQPAELEHHAPVLHLLASLLGQIRQADLLRGQAVEREAQLRWQAFHDPLTGLPNRALFLEHLARGLTCADHAERPTGVLLVDVDDFKAVNDTFGHASGDTLLALLAQRLQGAVGPRETLARLGGDEFAVVVSHGQDPCTLAQHLVDLITEPFALEDDSVHISASVGVASAAGQTTTAALLAQADVAMYSAKHSGKNCSNLYDTSSTPPRMRDLQLREPLRQAIATGAVQAHYQPIVDLADGRVTGFEALARWQHQGQHVSPATFIPIAARAGLLPALTEHVLAQASAQLAAWSAQLGHHELRVSVNVPPTLISDPLFAASVAGHVRRHALAPHQLVLELTEDALLGDLAAARAVTAQLHEIGVDLSLDDFGTGYSSLMHLHQIPLDFLKIDRGFVHDVDTNPRTRRFVRALLALGRNLGLQVIVEGVERPTQADVLRRLGASRAQGYLYSPAVPPAHAQTLLRTTRTSTTAGSEPGAARARHGRPPHARATVTAGRAGG